MTGRRSADYSVAEIRGQLTITNKSSAKLRRHLPRQGIIAPDPSQVFAEIPAHRYPDLLNLSGLKLCTPFKAHAIRSKHIADWEMAELPNFNTLFSLDGKVALVTGGK